MVGKIITIIASVSTAISIKIFKIKNIMLVILMAFEFDFEPKPAVQTPATEHIKAGIKVSQL